MDKQLRPVNTVSDNIILNILALLILIKIIYIYLSTILSKIHNLKF